MDAREDYDKRADELNKITDRDIEENEIRRAIERRPRVVH